MVFRLLLIITLAIPMIIITNDFDDDYFKDYFGWGSSMLCIQTGTALDWTGGIRGT